LLTNFTIFFVQNCLTIIIIKYTNDRRSTVVRQLRLRLQDSSFGYK